MIDIAKMPKVGQRCQYIFKITNSLDKEGFVDSQMQTAVENFVNKATNSIVYLYFDHNIFQ